MKEQHPLIPFVAFLAIIMTTSMWLLGRLVGVLRDILSIMEQTP